MTKSGHIDTSLTVIALVEGVIQWLNALTSPNGVSDMMIPESIFPGNQNPDLNQKRVIFEAYVMVYIGTENNKKIISVP